MEGLGFPVEPSTRLVRLIALKKLLFPDPHKDFTLEMPRTKSPTDSFLSSRRYYDRTCQDERRGAPFSLPAAMHSSKKNLAYSDISTKQSNLQTVHGTRNDSKSLLLCEVSSPSICRSCAEHPMTNHDEHITDGDSLSTITQDNGSDLLPFLQDLRIKPNLARSYRRKLKDNGYEDILALYEADDEELQDLGIKIGHVKRLKRAVARSSSDHRITYNINDNKLNLSPGRTRATVGPPALLKSSQQLTESVKSMSLAKERIMRQAERILKLEAELSSAGKNPQSAPLKIRAPASEDASRLLSAEERLQAHRDRKRQENRYKDLSGKWEVPTPVKNKQDLKKRVKSKDDLVDRLNSTGSERRRKTEMQQAVDSVIHKYANAIEEDISDRKINARATKRSQNNIQLCRRQYSNHRKEDQADEAFGSFERSDHGQTRSQRATSEPARRFSKECEVSKRQCDTCNSCESVEEDLDDPGLFYCQRCWEEYELSASSPAADVPNKNLALPQSVLDSSARRRQEKLPALPPKDRALWIVHDNPQLGNQVVASGAKQMKCLIETKDFDREGCVRILTGTIDYSGAAEQSDIDRLRVSNIETGTECLRLRSVRGYLVDHSAIETRLSGNRSIREFHLKAGNATALTGKDATMSSREFLEGCKGSVDVIIDPQCSSGEWYPQREASSGENARKLAPQFRSKGVGYIRLGDDMGKNGQAFLSSDACRSFFSTSVATSSSFCGFEDDLAASKAQGMQVVPHGYGRGCSGSQGTKVAANDARERQMRSLTLDFSDDDEDSKNDYVDDCCNGEISTDEEGEEEVGAADILKHLQSAELAREMKWNEKVDLLNRLGEALGGSGIRSGDGQRGQGPRRDGDDRRPPPSRGHCTTALKVIQDVLGGKNVNVHVVRAAVQSVGNVGERLERELVSEPSWRPIMLEMLRLLKSRQLGPVSRANLRRLHGTCYTLANSLTCLSHALGLGKEAATVGKKRAGGRQRPGLAGGGRPKQFQSAPPTASSAALQASARARSSNNVEVVEWLAKAVEAERRMTGLVPMADRSALATLAGFFVSHVGHRDPRCRRNVLDGLLHVLVYGVHRLGLEVTDAQSLCSELQSTNPRGWKTIANKVHQVLEKEGRNPPDFA